MDVTETKDVVPPVQLEAQQQDQPEGPEGAHHRQYIFKRLRQPMSPPSNTRLHIVTFALMMSMTLCGWNDGSVGPLFPSLQEYYHINYLVMSLIYTTIFAGALTGGLTNVWITDRIGFGLISPLGASCNALAYLLAGTGAPYAVFLIAYVFNGFGLSLQEAQTNNLTSRLPNAGKKMSFVQASYSVGGTIAPFISTAFAQHVHKTYRYFFVAMAVALLTVVLMLFAFEGKTEEQLVGHLNKDDSVPLETKPESQVVETVGHADEPAQPQLATETVVHPKPPSSGAKMKRILSTPCVYALMAFAFIYVGVEVAISGWLTSFLIRERGGSASAGYATTGFWGGMTVGRIVLIPITERIGNQVSIYACSVIALALELVIWFTHSLVGNGVCFAFVGFFLGPVYPNALMLVSEVLDDDLRAGVMGIMGSMGGAGAAAVPFITGAISDRFGIWTIQPIAVAMIATYTLLWTLVPRRPLKPKRAT